MNASKVTPAIIVKPSTQAVHSMKFLVRITERVISSKAAYVIWAFQEKIAKKWNSTVSPVKHNAAMDIAT